MSKQDLHNCSSDALQLSKLERTVITIWSEVLQVDDINPEDNFFELGGDSLTIMMVLFRVNDELHIELQPSAIAESPTLREFCQFVESNRNALEAQTLPDGPTLDSLDEETGVI